MVLYRVNPPAQITSIVAPPGNQLQVQGFGLSNLTFTIEASSNLVDWVSIGNAPANSSGAFSFLDTNAPQFNRRFYRALSP